MTLSARGVEQRGWHLQPDHPRRVQVDHQLEFVRLLDRDVCGLGPAENFD
jgi:hypothetical protein